MRVSLAQRELFGEIYARKRIAPPASAENETNVDVSSSAAENTIEKEGTDELL